MRKSTEHFFTTSKSITLNLALAISLTNKAVFAFEGDFCFIVERFYTGNPKNPFHYALTHHARYGENPDEPTVYTSYQDLLKGLGECTSWGVDFVIGESWYPLNADA